LVGWFLDFYIPSTTQAHFRTNHTFAVILYQVAGHRNTREMKNLVHISAHNTIHSKDNKAKTVSS